MYSETNISILLSNDYNILTNIYHSYDRTCIPWTYKQHLDMPVNETLTLEKFLNASANMYMGLISYIKSIPEFNNLSVNSKLSLIKNNLNHIMRINSTLIMKIITPDLDKDAPIFLHIFPQDLYLDMRAYSTALIPFVHDPLLLKLFITVLMLSTYMNIEYEKKQQIEINDEYSTQNIFNVQNIYIELLWRYIRSRCSNYQQSVLLLTSFVTRTLQSQLVQVRINHFIQTILPKQTESLEPIIKSMWISQEQKPY